VRQADRVEWPCGTRILKREESDLRDNALHVGKLLLAAILILSLGSVCVAESKASVPEQTGTQSGQGSTAASHVDSKDAPRSDREVVLRTIENFYIGDHTGSLEHKKSSMHPLGEYRYVDKAGEYEVSRFQLVESRGDTAYEEELLSLEIYENVALARVRLENQRREEAEYKLMTLHRVKGEWLVTGISWGWGVVH